jgi:death-on-curing protein
VNWTFLDVEKVVAIHDRNIAEFGGAPGLRDRGLLESAVARAENKATYDLEATLGSVAASFSFGLIKNHAFIDGNKRIGLAALNTFLYLNGYGLTVSQPERIAAVLAAASSEMSEAEWTTWVESHIAPLQP